MASDHALIEVSSDHEGSDFGTLWLPDDLGPSSTLSGEAQDIDDKEERPISQHSHLEYADHPVHTGHKGAGDLQDAVEYPTPVTSDQLQLRSKVQSDCSLQDGGVHLPQHQQHLPVDENIISKVTNTNAPSAAQPKPADATAMRHSIETNFDWQDLQTRFHSELERLNEKEKDIFREFDIICNSFAAWCESMQQHEQDRAFKRMRTQIAYVQHEEDELEKKKQHYQQVVNAFKNAIRLLNA